MRTKNKNKNFKEYEFVVRQNFDSAIQETSRVIYLDSIIL